MLYWFKGAESLSVLLMQNSPNKLQVDALTIL